MTLQTERGIFLLENWIRSGNFLLDGTLFESRVNFLLSANFELGHVKSVEERLDSPDLSHELDIVVAFLTFLLPSRFIISLRLCRNFLMNLIEFNRSVYVNS